MKMKYKDLSRVPYAFLKRKIDGNGSSCAVCTYSPTFTLLYQIKFLYLQTSFQDVHRIVPWRWRRRKVRSSCTHLTYFFISLSLDFLQTQQCCKKIGFQTFWGNKKEIAFPRWADADVRWGIVPNFLDFLRHHWNGMSDLYQAILSISIHNAALFENNPKDLIWIFDL